MRVPGAALAHGVSAETGLLVAVVAADPVRQADMAARVALAGHTVTSSTDPDVILADGLVVTRTQQVVLRLSAQWDDPGNVLPPDLTPRQLDAGLRAVAAGLRVGMSGPDRIEANRSRNEPAHTPLTPREVEILRCLGEGLSNKAVARALGISAHTVKFHLEAVFIKLGAASRAEAVAKGLRQGLILL